MSVLDRNVWCCTTGNGCMGVHNDRDVKTYIATGVGNWGPRMARVCKYYTTEPGKSKSGFLTFKECCPQCGGDH
jgi:hypothetical protein